MPSGRAYKVCSNVAYKSLCLIPSINNWKRCSSICKWCDDGVVGRQGERRRSAQTTAFSPQMQARPKERDRASIRRTHPAIVANIPAHYSTNLPLPPARHSIARLHASEMTDASTGTAPPKKRSLFKRAAWQDAAKKEDEDIFSHSNEFKDLVAEENRRKEEEKRKQVEVKRRAEEEQRREQAEKEDKKGKRRRISTDHDEPVVLPSGSHASEGISKSQSKA